MGPRVNDKISAKTVQVISQDGQNLGVMDLSDALNTAYDSGLDLVEINASASPVLVKIMDYGKYKYEQKKRASEARKKQKTVEVREVWVTPVIEENDFNVKMKKVFEFLDGGNKVKIAVMTHGDKRVLARTRDAVPQLFARIIDLIGDKGVVESKSKPEDRTKSIIIAPAK
ncbi:MAG: translation initiation factor IF-3 [Alphaproteobacteria bacterium]|nr:translation initiation factor IF-3 [Alphaproteobacteria bacterium]